MPRKRYNHNQKQIDKRIKSGKGSGVLENYQPYIDIRDISSLGRSARELGWKTGRVHHLLSDLERYFFYILEWSPYVIDIREQVNIPQNESIQIANDLKITHPWYWVIENGFKKNS